MTDKTSMIDGLIYGRPIEKAIASLAKSSVRLEVNPSRNGCEQAWELWNRLNSVVKPFAQQEIPIALGHYRTLVSIQDTLTNTCGPDVNESKQ